MSIFQLTGTPKISQNSTISHTRLRENINVKTPLIRKCLKVTVEQEVCKGHVGWFLHYELLFLFYDEKISLVEKVLKGFNISKADTIPRFEQSADNLKLGFWPRPLRNKIKMDLPSLQLHFTRLQEKLQPELLELIIEIQTKLNLPDRNRSGLLECAW